MENRRVVLASRPEGAVSEDNFRIESAPLPRCGDGEVLVRNLWLSLDPYMRGRMSDAKSYVKGVDIGERSEEHTSELQSRLHLVCRLLLEKKKKCRKYTKHH